MQRNLDHGEAGRLLVISQQLDRPRSGGRAARLGEEVRMRRGHVGEEGEARGRLVPAAGAEEGLSGGQLVDRALQVTLV